MINTLSTYWYIRLLLTMSYRLCSLCAVFLRLPHLKHLSFPSEKVYKSNRRSLRVFCASRSRSGVCTHPDCAGYSRKFPPLRQSLYLTPRLLHTFLCIGYIFAYHLVKLTIFVLDILRSLAHHLYTFLLIL